MNSIKKLADIQCLINEAYSDKEPLTDEQKASKKVFNGYCDDIRKDLAKLDDIENQPCVEGYKERTSQKVLDGLHALCLKGTDRAYWGMVRHIVEQIRKDLDVLEILKSKNVDLMSIRLYITKKYEDALDTYNRSYKDELTEDEFNKIKEWLER